MIALCLFLSSIVSISAQQDKFYWIECSNFPYDFIIDTNEQIHIYYVDKRIHGSEHLISNDGTHIQLDIKKIEDDFNIEAFPMYNHETKKVQLYFQQILKNLNPSILLKFNQYVKHNLSFSEVTNWYQLYLDKPKIQTYVYPALSFEDQYYLLSEDATLHTKDMR